MATTHPSTWFTYVRVARTPDSGVCIYEECVLLRNLPFTDTTKSWQAVTFHNDAYCLKDRCVSRIEEHHGQLVGWQGDDLVMDIMWK